MKILSQCKILIFSIDFNMKFFDGAWWDSPVSWFFFSLSFCFLFDYFIRTVCYWWFFLSCPSASVISPSSDCCQSVCLYVCLRALLCKALAEWWKHVLFIRVREGEGEGGIYCIDTIVKRTCDSQKCIIKCPQKCLFFSFFSFTCMCVYTCTLMFVVGKWFFFHVYALDLFR